MIKKFAGSSWIKEVRYDTEAERMWIVYKDSDNTYELEDVPEEVYEEFEKATSRGKYHNENIRGKYVAKYFRDLGY